MDVAAIVPTFSVPDAFPAVPFPMAITPGLMRDRAVSAVAAEAEAEKEKMALDEHLQPAPDRMNVELAWPIVLAVSVPQPKEPDELPKVPFPI
jgi:hypothetical protein